MSKKISSELTWLPTSPKNFKEQCSQIELLDQARGSAIIRLATHALNTNQLHTLAGLILKSRKSGDDLSPLKNFRLGILSDTTTSLVMPSLVGSAARHGLLIEIIDPGFAQVALEALNPSSMINASKCDAILLSLNYRNLTFEGKSLGDPIAEKTAVQNALSYVQSIMTALRRYSGSLCIIETIPRSPEALFGSYDRNLPCSPWRLIGLFNQGLADSVRESGDILFDVATLAETVGLADWHDSAQWFLGKIPFSQSFVPLYTETLSRLIACIRGSSRKCLVLDLDNTLWGGVIGDDGLAGIRLGQGDPIGEAFLDFQKTALQLRERGIMLAVCSKNEDDNARLPFQNHPEMLLKEHHITVFQANWKDKASNLKSIAEQLKLSLDALVFVDDSPAERALVRQVLPTVAVPELPEDPSLYSRTLLAGGYFESTSFTPEDQNRVEYYRSNAERAAVLEHVGDYDSYLKSLEMTIHFSPFDQVGRSRIAQLVNKSNQFNLTSRRLTEAQIEQMRADPNFLTLQVRLRDRFGDNGMISVVICEKATPSEWIIHTWLMSCRVLNRRIEEAVLNELVTHLRKRNARQLIGHCIPTEKNKLVQNHFKELGFSFVHEQENLTTVWKMDLSKYQWVELPMQFTRD